MCGRVNVSNRQSIKKLMTRIGVPAMQIPDFRLSEKLHPYYKPLVCVFRGETQAVVSTMMNWGWHRDWDKNRRLFNSRRISAKGKHIWHSEVWGEAVRKRRCLIPVNAFYEWNENQPRGKRDCYRIETHDDAFMLGGIYEVNQQGNCDMSICTTEPNRPMKIIHHRMPVIIDLDDANLWLCSDDRAEIDYLMQSKAEGDLMMINEIQIGKTRNMF